MEEKVFYVWKMGITLGKARAVFVVKWSACSPSTPKIRIRAPLKLTVFIM